MELLNMAAIKKKAKTLTGLLLLLLVLPCCRSMLQRGGELLERNNDANYELSHYRSGSKRNFIELKELKLDNGEWIIEFTNSQWPGLVLRGSMPDGRGNFEIFQARILSSHSLGWNEIYLDIYGNGVFNDPMKRGAILYINGEVERFRISSGMIRLRSSRLTGESALVTLRNRRERIIALNEWMENWMEDKGENRDFNSLKEFERYWRPLLFPELLSRRKRPEEYATVSTGVNSENQWIRADSVKWNRNWTEYIFDESLWELRNSGCICCCLALQRLCVC